MRPMNGQQSARDTRRSIRPGVRWTGEAADLPTWSYPVTVGYKRAPRNPPPWTGGGGPGPLPDSSQAPSGSRGSDAIVGEQGGTPPKDGRRHMHPESGKGDVCDLPTPRSYLRSLLEEAGEQADQY
ncbi:Hypothetical predicted protein [Pelobates cultripes]|uniref:Uncharacterized protein n=1 Tax=Pelobates cultripes TaxID=61616 RepID=A0AAD1W3A8_PELCU|nr:Hypothetical predicted protein [Pelobates cultripes]